MIKGAGISRSSRGFRYERPAGFRYWTLSCQVRGENLKTVNGRAVLRRPPYAALTRPDTRYRVETTPRGRRYLEYWVVFVPRPEWARLLDWPEEQPGAMHVRLTAPGTGTAIRRAFEELLATTRALLPEKEALAENALERILLLMQTLHAARAGRVTDPRVQRAVDWMNARFREPLTLAALAAPAHLSPSRLSHLFAGNVGMPPMRYLELRRIEAAQALLLSTNESVRAIAEQVGFSNPYHFSTRFRRRVGLAPRAFRAQSLRPRSAGAVHGPAGAQARSSATVHHQRLSAPVCVRRRNRADTGSNRQA